MTTFKGRGATALAVVLLIAPVTGEQTPARDRSRFFGTLRLVSDTTTRRAILAASLSAQTTNAASDHIRTVVGRLELERFKAHIKGLTQFGDRMAGTDSIQFQDLAPSVSVRENERITGIIQGSNPNHHQATDAYNSYGEGDFRFGFGTVRTTLGALGQLAGVSLAVPRSP